MTHDEYCIQVCGGKCCKNWEENEEGQIVPYWSCPNQNQDGSCAIYEEWEGVGTCGQSPEGKSTEMIALWLLNPNNPQWIKDQCCYEHPELLL